MAFTAILTFAGCSSDDDGDQNCRSCDILGLVPAQICDNENGTATLTVDGESENIDLEGTDFNTVADGLCNGDIDFEL